MAIAFLITMAWLSIKQEIVYKTANQLARFKSGEELIKVIEEARKQSQTGFMLKKTGVPSAPMPMALTEGLGAGSPRAYSETNIQVEGVDEADIVKTDGTYIYAIGSRELIITKAYPAEQAEILSKLQIDNFRPEELFIHKNKLLLFGSAEYNFKAEEVGKPIPDIWPPRYLSATSLKLYDISNKENPSLVKSLDFEGSYLTSRKIEENVYFVLNAYPRYFPEPRPLCEDIVPLYRESKDNDQPDFKDMQPIARCVDIGYIEPIQAESFIIIASISMENGEVQKEIIVGSGQNVYASLENLYIAQTSWPRYEVIGKLIGDFDEQTIITKFKLVQGKIVFQGTGKVKGHILNQFSMDEHNSYFRIATTRGQVWDENKKSSNNIYVLNKDLVLVGSLEDLAPGEKIYSARFMGERVYLVTFKKVDPLFVIDLAEPTNPHVLGKLKIPGYSDYLHPYDETHIIGIGKETVEAEEELKQGRGLDFAWYQGVKMALFDVSDIENPMELHKEVIGDRGTDSEVLRNHKAFLFDKQKNLLVLPITLAEIKGEKTQANQYGEFTFQGAYVYELTLERGFYLRGRITHYDSDESFKKSGYYFNGQSSIQRALYIEEVLYTLSNSRLQLNNLDNLERLKVLEFGE